jgi:hypothetical protein
MGNVGKVHIGIVRVTVGFEGLLGVFYFIGHDLILSNYVANRIRTVQADLVGTEDFLFKFLFRYLIFFKSFTGGLHPDIPFTGFHLIFLTLVAPGFACRIDTTELTGVSDVPWMLSHPVADAIESHLGIPTGTFQTHPLPDPAIVLGFSSMNLLDLLRQGNARLGH